MNKRIIVDKLFDDCHIDYHLLTQGKVICEHKRV